MWGGIVGITGISGTTVGSSERSTQIDTDVRPVLASADTRQSEALTRAMAPRNGFINQLAD